ncbi:MAG: hypothetical protein IPP77_00045 [Bacteroidetes bacterium]|nr:hypothetical protein [Bacteroidota bacterium]
MSPLGFLHIALFLIYAALLFVFILRGRFFLIEGISRKHLSFFFLFKVVAGILLVLVYTHYYTDRFKQDIYRYFDDSVIISNILFINPLAWLKVMTGYGMYEPKVFQYLVHTEHFTHPVHDIVTSNFLIIRLISLLNFFSAYNIYINTLFFSFFSFTGCVLLFKSFRPYFSSLPALLYLPLFLVPSVVFWSSGLLKETILFFAIGIYLRSLLKWNSTRNDVYIIMSVLAFVVIALTKIYLAATLLWCSFLLPINLSSIKSRFETERRMVVFVLIGLFSVCFYGTELCNKVIEKRNEFVTLAIDESAGSAIDLEMQPIDCTSLFALLPKATFGAIFRPFVWEGNLIQKGFALETGILVLIALYLLRFIRLPVGDRRWLALFCLSFSLINYAIIGATVPIMGAIVHYRVVSLVFMLLFIMLLMDEEKLKWEKIFSIFSNK